MAVPVRLWAFVPAELHEFFRQHLTWLDAKNVKVYRTNWFASLPSSPEAIWRVNWLWERLRGRTICAAVYASWGLHLERLPLVPLPFDLHIESGIFGSGKHPTTQMCLVALQNLQLQGKRLLDVGTGSGILAAFALNRGAQVVATDISFRAAKQATKNLSTQKKGSWAVIVCDLAECLQGNFDVVVCNISGEAIERLLKSLEKIMPEGILVASGWMVSEFRSIQKVLRSCGLKMTSWQFFNGWVGITVEKAKTLALNRPS